MVSNMSDPVTNAEVEDVLSSIRRLVSQDKRPLNRAKADAPSADKLVLTPSLRVSNEAPLKDAYKPQSQATEWTDTPAEDDRDVRSAAPTEASTPAEAVEEDIGDLLSNDPDDDDDFYLLADADTFGDEGDDDDVQASASGAVDPGVDGDNDLAPSEPPQTAPQNRPDMLSLGASELVEDAAPAPDRLSAKIAALESAISRIPENWEPDTAGEGDYSGSEAPAMAWEDDIDLDATGAPLADDHRDSDASEKTAATAPEPNTAMYFEDDGDVEDDRFDDEDIKQPDSQANASSALGLGGEEFMDEEMLRDLVADIVRSELQGALGERITRNVRKLVRREIHRALTAQDLE